MIFKNIYGESALVNPETESDWIKNRLPAIIKNYKSNDIFNGDEFGCFFKLLPNKTYAFKNDKCKGGKSSKE